MTPDADEKQQIPTSGRHCALQALRDAFVAINTPELVPNGHHRCGDNVAPAAPRSIDASPKQNDADNHEEDVNPCTFTCLTLRTSDCWFRVGWNVVLPDGELISLVQRLQLVKSSLSSMKPVTRVVESLSESFARETLSSFALFALARLSSELDRIQVDFS